MGPWVRIIRRAVAAFPGASGTRRMPSTIMLRPKDKVLTSMED